MLENVPQQNENNLFNGHEHQSAYNNQSNSNNENNALLQNQKGLKRQRYSHRLHNLKTQQAQCSQVQFPSQTQNNPHHLTTPMTKPTLTHRDNILKSIHQSNQLILVYLMYKQQKLSLFLNKDVSFEYLTKKLYKEIYIYEKETYSISNAILKNLLNKITGFESIDNDLVYDYQLKYKRGTLVKQKFFVPFKQDDMKMPFKFYGKLKQNVFGGNQFLVRVYSDGEWATLSTIKKNHLDQDKINSIKKSLKNNHIAGSLLTKNCASSFSQFNWLQTKHYLMVSSEFFPQNLQENLIKNKSKHIFSQINQQIFVYYAKWFAHVLRQMVLANVQIFKKLCLKNIGLNAGDGLPKVIIADNVSNGVDFAQKRRSVLSGTNLKRNSDRISDKFYYETYLNIVDKLTYYLFEESQSNKILSDFLDFLKEQTCQINFSFEIVLKYLSFDDPTATWNTFQRQRQKHCLRVDFSSKINEIAAQMDQIKHSTSQTLLISQAKQQIQKTFSMQNMRRNQQRNQKQSILQMISTTMNFNDIKKQNIGNVTQFKKEEQRKFHLKTKQKQYILDIINELNQNQNFIKTTKQNNLASILFYLKKSDQKVKKKMVEKIQTKYKKFFERRQTIQHSDQDHLLAKDVNLTYQNSPQKITQSQKKTYYLPICNKMFQKNKIRAQKGSQTVEQNLQKNISLFSTNQNRKQNLRTQKSQKTQETTLASKTVGHSLKKNFTNPGFHPNNKLKRTKLQELFVNNKDFPKQQKIVLKKKQYGIYLEQAQKQYNKIRMYRKNTVNQTK